MTDSGIGDHATSERESELRSTSALARFSELMTCPDDAIPLAQVALTIARVHSPRVDVRACLDEIDALTDRISAGWPGDASTHRQVSYLSHALFVDENFRGNVENYYDPLNSCLNSVLERRTGIPITLAVIYLEVAWRLGLPVTGVGFPGHFLVKWEIDEGVVVVDPFSAGATLGLDELATLARRAGVNADPREFLDSVSRSDIVVRILRNLCGITAREALQGQQLEVLNMLLIVLPDAAPERIVRAELLESLDCPGAALQDLSHLKELGLSELPDGRILGDEIHRLRIEQPLTH